MNEVLLRLIQINICKYIEVDRQIDRLTFKIIFVWYLIDDLSGPISVSKNPNIPTNKQRVHKNHEIDDFIHIISNENLRTKRRNNTKKF